MKLRIFWLLFWCLCFWAKGIGQTSDPLDKASLKDSTTVNKILKVAKEKFSVDPAVAMNLAIQARDISQRIHFRKGEATAIKTIGNAYYLQKNPSEALLRWQEALRIFEEIDDKMGVADLLGNIGAFYYSRGDNVKALDNYLQSLKIAESIGHKKAMASALNNIGGIYYSKTDTIYNSADDNYSKALSYYLEAIPLCQELGDVNTLGAISVNVGNIFLKKKEDTKAIDYFNRALKAFSSSPANISPVYNALGALYLGQGNTSLALKNYKIGLDYGERTSGQLNMVKSLIGIGRTLKKEKRFKEALVYYKQAEKIVLDIKAIYDSEELYEDMASTYASISDFNNAFRYQMLLTKVKESIYNKESDDKIAGLQFDFQLEKKQNQINLLKKDQALTDVELKRQRLAKNAFMAGLVLIFFIAFIIYRNYRAKVKINKVLDHQKEQIEQLLLNILPVEVAKELQDHGHATPRNYESVSVLFTDFKGFTSIADKMTPAELVEDLNTCFMAFDDIIIRHNLEKIKTIGDSYMCAGGIPTPDDNHVYNMVKASLEIQEYIRKNNERRLELGLVPWEARVGVHVGPVVAGVVGKKKYAYDIWGSTVNIASRMESNGAPGRVNISSAVYEKVKEKYACAYRGKIYAKNVGEVDMYFIERELQPGEPVPVIEVPGESPIKAEELLQ